MSSIGCPWCHVVGGHEPLCLGAVEVEEQRRVTAKVNISDTSLEAFRDNRETFVNREAQALDVLRRHGAMTSNELFERHLKPTFPQNYRHNTHARLSALRDKGLVHVAGKRECGVTGLTANVWAVTPPGKERELAQASLRARLAAAERLVAQLRAKLGGGA